MSRLLALSTEEKNQILKYLPNDTITTKLASFFQSFSDLTRLKIIICLSIGPMCVNDMSSILNLNQTTISHQMQILKAQNIVDFTRQGKMIFYSLKGFEINNLMLGEIEAVC